MATSNGTYLRRLLAVLKQQRERRPAGNRNGNGCVRRCSLIVIVWSLAAPTHLARDQQGVVCGQAYCPALCHTVTYPLSCTTHDPCTHTQLRTTHAHAHIQLHTTHAPHTHTTTHDPCTRTHTQLQHERAVSDRTARTHRQPSTHSPSGRSAGMTTVSMISRPDIMRPEHLHVIVPSSPG